MIGILLILAAQFAFAVGILFAKKLTSNTNEFLVASIVTLIGAIVMLPFLFYFSKYIRLFTPQKLIWAILAGISWIAIGEILYLSGLARTTMLNASLLALTFPLFAGLLASIFLGETITLKFMVASLFIIIGFLILSL